MPPIADMDTACDPPRLTKNCPGSKTEHTQEDGLSKFSIFYGAYRQNATDKCARNQSNGRTNEAKSNRAQNGGLLLGKRISLSQRSPVLPPARYLGGGLVFPL